MLRVVVCVSGGGTNLQAMIDGIKEGRINNAGIVRVISNNRDAYALKRAEENHIPGVCISPKDYADREAFHKALLEAVREAEPDLIVLAGFLVVIPKEMIAEYTNKIINIHPSLIPSFCGTGYYGMKVHEGALNRGVKITGATVHFVDEGTDTGPILLQKPVEIMEGDTPEILQRRVMEEAEWILLPEAVDAIANGRVEIKDNRCRILKNRKDSGVS
ncbi:MAG: phosphoribosylglycinamide formyltransferase [Kineothrix sp.]|nr:phosphoribosylglycinamide formyltransferase [Lachnospiraceae bacterium 28-4]MCX4343566.1 phosphoribosylglycinamide formyltransferase [Kineothrix sp.]